MTSPYFAYGSSLNSAEWESWCREKRLDPRSIEPLFPAWLPDHCVAFTRFSNARQSGVLDILPALGCLVPGLVFRVNPGGWPALHRKEGSPGAYHRVSRTCLTRHGKAHSVRTYEVRTEQHRSFVPPTPAYLEIVNAGLEALGLPHDHITRAAANLPPEPLDAVFVYGTLRRGQPLHHPLAAARAEIPATAPGRLFDCGEYPAMALPSPGATTLIRGELVLLRDIATLSKLDEIEGFAGFSKELSLFSRRLIEVSMEGGNVRRAWVYLGGTALDTPRPKIPSGDWLQHLAARP
jgi:gamma-glutamylcyclotransferase (GGCT)/AIG2-like uncharacterized protein YtfP